MKSSIAAPFLLAALAGSPVVHAQSTPPDQGFYLGASAGQARTDVPTGEFNDDLLGLGVATARTTSDDKDTGWKLYAGYQFNRNLALELGYADLGKFTLTGVTTGPSIRAHGDIKVKALSLDAVGIAPVAGRVALFGKLGVTYWDTDINVSATGAGLTDRSSDSDDGFGWKAGLGARFDITRNVGVRLEWERYFRVGEDKDDVDLLSLGLQFRF